MAAPSFEQSEESYSPLMNKYQEAVSVTDTYHETKSRFAWIGEIENEQLLTALETLKTEDLEIITMYAYEGYDITEISKVYGVSRPTISIKIKRITKFLKNFNFNEMCIRDRGQVVYSASCTQLAKPPTVFTSWQAAP